MYTLVYALNPIQDNALKCWETQQSRRETLAFASQIQEDCVYTGKERQDACGPNSLETE